MRRPLLLLLLVAAVCSVSAAGSRLALDRGWGNRVGIAAELSDVVKIADLNGLPLRDVLERFSRVGLTTVIATVGALDAAEAARGEILRRPGEPAWSPLVSGEPGQSPAQVALLLDAVALRLEHRQAGPVLVAGAAVPGFPDALGVTASRLTALGLRLGLVEDPGQLGYVPLPGTPEIAADLGYSFVRVYRQPPAALAAPERVLEKTVRSAKERSLRLIWLDLFTFAGGAPAEWLSRPTGEVGALAVSLRYVEEIARSLRRAGFEVGLPSVAAPEGHAGAGPGVLAGIALGPWAASLLALDFLTRGRVSRSRVTVWLAFLTAPAVAAGAWLVLARQPVLARQALAFWSSLAYPSLALAWLGERWPQDDKPRTWPGVAEFGVALTVAVLGGLAVSGVLAHPRFASEVAYFRGVKLSYILPPLVGLAGTVWLSRGTGAGRAWSLSATHFRGGPRVWHVLVGAAAGLAVVVYVGRSGDQPWLRVSQLEISARVWLDTILGAQPRLKEFLIGHPALIVGSYLAWAARRRWLAVWVAAAGVGMVSIVNSFEHVRTPLTMTLLRTFHGAWLGLAAGLLLVLAASWLLPPVADRGNALSACGPGPDTGRRARDGNTGGDPPGDPDAGVTILGVRFHRVGLEEATDRAVRLIREARGGPAARLIFTPNPEIVMRAQRDPVFLATLNQADLVVADGIGVVWASGLLGGRRRRLRERVSGYDLLVALMARAGEVWGSGRIMRLYLLGGRPGVAEEAARGIESRYPGVQIVGVHSGYFAEDDAPLPDIRAARPDLVAIGLGSPKQETWAARHRGDLGGTVAICVGGSFDVLSGRTRRAPAWLRALGLEWAYRILFQPGTRLSRAPALARFVLSVLGTRLQSRHRR